MNESRPERPSLTPVAELLGEALAHYGRNAPLLIAVAVAGAFVGDVIALVINPDEFVVALIWAQFIAALITALQAPVWLLSALARRGEPLTASAVLFGLVSLSPRFFVVGLVLGIGAGGLLVLAASFPVLSLPALPVLIYFAVRFSLAGPAIVLENRSPAQALIRSWQVVEGNWWRTFVIQLPVLMFALMLLFMAGAVGSRVDATVVAVALNALALGVGAPLVALVETALFEEYSKRQAHAIGEGEE